MNSAAPGKLLDWSWKGWGGSRCTRSVRCGHGWSGHTGLSGGDLLCQEISEAKVPSVSIFFRLCFPCARK